MKKFIYLLFAGGIFMFAACGGNSTQEAATQEAPAVEERAELLSFKEANMGGV